MFGEIVVIIMVERGERGRMEENKNKDNVRMSDGVGVVGMVVFSVLNDIFLVLEGKLVGKMMGDRINVCKFRVWKDSDNGLNVIIGEYKFNGFMGMFVIMRKIYLLLFGSEVN